MTSANNKEPSQQGKVLTLSNIAETNDANSAYAPQRNKLMYSFILCVLLPFILAAIYYTLIATDRYAARAGFSIRGMETSSGIDGIGALTGLASSGSTTSDSYIVLSYLKSRELVEDLDDQLDLKRIFSAADVDLLSRLSKKATVEDFLYYWEKRIQMQFDPASGIVEFEVQSFSPEHAREIAAAVLSRTQLLVNELSASARKDALKFAREEVDLQETRLRDALTAVRDFRASEQSVDPSASAALEIELISSLEAQLIDVNARITALRQTLDENAPSLAALRRNAEALETQILERRGAVGNDVLNGSGPSEVTQQLARYEELMVERSLAQQAYASALASLEQARRDADRQQRYLAVHLHPQVAQSAKYPRVMRNLFVLGFALLAGWGIGALLTYSVRDHLT